jgi:hypothetical protein
MQRALVLAYVLEAVHARRRAGRRPAGTGGTATAPCWDGALARDGKRVAISRSTGVPFACENIEQAHTQAPSAARRARGGSHWNGSCTSSRPEVATAQLFDEARACHSALAPYAGLRDLRRRASTTERRALQWPLPTIISAPGSSTDPERRERVTEETKRSAFGGGARAGTSTTTVQRWPPPMPTRTPETGVRRCSRRPAATAACRRPRRDRGQRGRGSERGRSAGPLGAPGTLLLELAVAVRRCSRPQCRLSYSRCWCSSTTRPSRVTMEGAPRARRFAHFPTLRVLGLHWPSHGQRSTSGT